MATAIIVKIEKIASDQKRFDIQTSTQNFYANDVLVHNSMICPFMASFENEYGPRWGTKMGINDISAPVEAFVATRPEYNELAWYCINGDATPIFEWCSRKQRIVIDYPEDQLVLTAIRDNLTGEYCDYPMMVEIAKSYGIPYVKAYEGTAENMTALMEYTRDLKNFEGFVVRFDDGHMIKVKAEDYLRKHKVKEAIQLEKNVIEMLVNEKADDVKAFLDEADLARLEAFEVKFWFGVQNTAMDIRTQFEAAKFLGLTNDRARYAVEFVQKQPKYLQGMFYRMLVEQNAFKIVKETIAKSVSTQTKVDEARVLFNCNWNEV